MHILRELEEGSQSEATSSYCMHYNTLHDSPVEKYETLTGGLLPRNCVVCGVYTPFSLGPKCTFQPQLHELVRMSAVDWMKSCMVRKARQILGPRMTLRTYAILVGRNYGLHVICL